MDNAVSAEHWRNRRVRHWLSMANRGLTHQLLRWTVRLILATWLLGLALFLAYPKSFNTDLPVLHLHPNEPHNLVAAKYGPSIRASSYSRDTFRQHHPAYLCDGRSEASEHEKWVSAMSDREPWVELRWRGARSVDRVVIRRPLRPEPTSPLGRDYTVTCLQSQNIGPALTVHQGPAPIAEHQLHCANTEGLRVEFTSGEEVQLEELEVWGQ